MSVSPEMPLVNVITTIYTDERLNDLYSLLQSLSRQVYKTIELICVVERSEELLHRIKQFCKDNQYEKVTLLFNEGPWGLSAARNLAIKHAQGEIIAFIDDDAVAFPEWIEEIVKAFKEDSNLIGVTGPIYPLWEEESMAWFPKELYWIFSCTYQEENIKMYVRNGYGTNIAFKCEAFDLCGDFKTELGLKSDGKNGINGPVAEEMELSVRVTELTNKYIAFCPTVKVYHRVYKYRFTRRYIEKRSYWEGYAKAKVKKEMTCSIKGKKILRTEYALLKQLLIRIITLSAGIVWNPLVNLKQIYTIITVLSWTAVGYFSYYLNLS
jgi:glycosyltransferase involved in cell wall biosynthesis